MLKVTHHGPASSTYGDAIWYPLLPRWYDYGGNLLSTIVVLQLAFIHVSFCRRLMMIHLIYSRQSEYDFAQIICANVCTNNSRECETAISPNDMLIIFCTWNLEENSTYAWWICNTILSNSWCSCLLPNSYHIHLNCVNIWKCQIVDILSHSVFVICVLKLWSWVKLLIWYALFVSDRKT